MVTKKVKLLNHYVYFTSNEQVYKKYFENENPNKSFLIKDEKMWGKHEQIWDVIKNKIGIKFHSEPVNEYKYLKTKVREYDGVTKTVFLSNDISKENISLLFLLLKWMKNISCKFI